MLHRYEWHTMRTETGVRSIEMYTASAFKYTVYKMYTRGREVSITWGGMCMWDMGVKHDSGDTKRSVENQI